MRVTIKEYALQKGISYEAVRAQIHRYSDELAGLIEKQGRTQFLTDEAVAFLDAKRASNPVVIKDMALDAELDRLKAEKEALLLKVATLQEMLLAEKDKVILLTENNAGLTAQLMQLQVASQTPQEPVGQASADKGEELDVLTEEAVQALSEAPEVPVIEQHGAEPPQAKRSLLERVKAAINELKKS